MVLGWNGKELWLPQVETQTKAFEVSLSFFLYLSLSFPQVFRLPFPKKEKKSGKFPFPCGVMCRALGCLFPARQKKFVFA